MRFRAGSASMMASAAGMEGKTAASVDEASGDGVLLLLIEQGRTREILHFKNVVRLLFPVSLPSPSPLRSPGVIVSRSEEHTSELQSLMRISYAVFCLKKKKDIIYTS